MEAKVFVSASSTVIENLWPVPGTDGAVLWMAVGMGQIQAMAAPLSGARCFWAVLVEGSPAPEPDISFQCSVLMEQQQ